jgi:prevent-host-death family protein
MTCFLPTGQYTSQITEVIMAKIIGTYEARTHWSEVIQEVKKGEHYVITHHGEPIAELVPPRPQTKQERSKRAARQLLDFMARRPRVTVNIKEAIEDGRD